jgi:hypothetical protein
MAQGDIVVIIDKLTKELDNLSSLNSSVKISQFEQGLIVDKILKSHEKALESRKEAYRYDLTQDTISSYLKKIHKHSKKYFEQKDEIKKEHAILQSQIDEYKKIEEKAEKESRDELKKYVSERRAQLEVEKAIKEAADDAANTGEMASKSGNPYLAAVIVVVGALITTAKALYNGAKILFNKITGSLKDVLGADFGIGAVYETFLRMQKMSGEFSANAGLIASESENFLWNMPRIMNEVLDVGGTIEQVGEVMETLSNVTGKNRMFTGKQFKSIIELGLGTGLGVEEGSELIGNFDNLGYSLDKTLELTDYARNKAMSVSQNQTGVLRKVNQLVVSLTGYGTSRGLKGMADLVVKTQKLRIDVVKSVDSFKDAFTDPESAIEVAATAQLLGGKFASLFGNAFTLMGKSMLEPQELTADLIEALKDKAFKGKNGFQISPADRQIIKEFAEAINQDPEELMTGAIEQTKYADKIDALNKRGLPIMMYNEDQRNLITNLMTLNEDGSYSMRLSNGIIKRLEEIPSMYEITKTLEQDRRNEQSALLRNTLAERIGIAIDRFNIGFSEVFVVLDKYFKRHNTIENLDTTVESITVGMMNWLETQFADTGDWGLFLRRGLKTANSFIEKILSFWTDPNSSLIEALSSSMDAIQDALKKYLMLPLKFYGGKMVQAIGEALSSNTYGLVGKKVQKAGLKLQMETLNEAGKDSSLYKGNYSGVIKDVEDYNEKYGDSGLLDLAAKSGFKLSSKTLAKAASKIGAKQIAKRIPGVGFFIGLYDAVSEALEGDYGQAGIAFASGVASTLPGWGTAISIGLDTANAGIDAAYGDNVIKTDDLLVRANGAILKGSKGDALLFFNEMVLGQALVTAKPKKVNLVLTGKITNISRDRNTRLSESEINVGVKEGSKIILKQVITNLETSV